MAISTRAYKGTRDFYPQAKRQQDYIFDVWSSVAISFGYEQYDAPIVEPLEIYQAKTSEEIVNEQTYSFEDRGGRKVTLRPEMTPTVSRMVAARRQELAYPLRWYSIPNLWRYERPQKGRLREHWQLNVDLFGVAGIEADHEMILIADTIMQRFGAKRSMYTIRLNSRQLINHILQDYLELDGETSVKVIRLIDHKLKMSESSFNAAIKEIIGDKTDRLIDVLNAKSINDLAKYISKHKSSEDLHHLEMMLARSGITNAQFDITLMRGFDYYTDIVFEVYDTNPENSRSLFGGGRYDGLVGLFGVEPIPTVGFGMGDVTTRDFLETHNLLPQIEPSVDLNVILIGDSYLQAQETLAKLRASGLNVAVDSSGAKVDKQLKNAVKAGYKHVLIIGEQELTEAKFNLKDLSTGQTQRLDVAQIINQAKTTQ